MLVCTMEQEYAERHYNIAYTLSFEEQVEGLAAFCHKRRVADMKLYHGSNNGHY